MPFSQNITPTFLDVRWGPDIHCRLDILRHATRLPSGNPCFTFRHGGGGGGRDKRLPWVAGGTMNLFANWVTQNPDLPCDFMSVESPQYDWKDPIPAAHLPTLTNEVRTTPVIFPRNVDWLKYFHQWLKAHGKGGRVVPELGTDLDIDPTRTISGGGSFGSMMQAVSVLSGPRTAQTTGGVILPGNRWGPYEVDSRPSGILLYNMPCDLRRLGGIDQVYYALWGPIFGFATIAELNRLTDGERAAFSPLAYIEAGDTRWAVPQYIINEPFGNHLKPYGDPATGFGADAHDSDQFTTYTNALTDRDLPWVGQILSTVSAWENETTGPVISQSVLDWARGIFGL